MKTTVIHHDADYDGLFCREIAKKFLPDAHIIGWDFGRPQLDYPEEGLVFVMDLPYLQVFKGAYPHFTSNEFIVLDHHKTSIADMLGDNMTRFCIDGVAACRLAWQYFTAPIFPLKQDFIDRKVSEPYAVTLAGEYDIWDHGASGGEDIIFQFGLKAEEDIRWPVLLNHESAASDLYVRHLIANGEICQRYVKNGNANKMKRAFNLEFEDLNFLALNTFGANSLTFESALAEEHDACLAYYWNGKEYIVSLYGSYMKPNIDLSVIAKKYGGGGHKQACGFTQRYLPWLPQGVKEIPK